MSNLIGRQALVVGAGLGGLTAARVLSDYVERVLVFERDALPTEADARAGIPQGRHVHVLLAGGLRALCDLFAGFEQTLIDTGAEPIIAGLDLRVERSGYDPYPQRDLGFVSYAQSRPQLELNVRRHALALPNIELMPRCRVRNFVANAEGAVTGLVYTNAAGQSATAAADLIIDASGRGGLTLDLLTSLGQPAPDTTVVGVDVAYASVVFAMPEPTPSTWKGVFTMPEAPKSSRGGLLMPIEGRRWIVSLGGRKGEEPPGDIEGFMTFASQLRTPTIYNAIKDAERLSDVVSFRFPDNIYRHFDRLEAFPPGLLPLGDAICRFNPVYGQGMSVAVLEAQALGRLLADRAGEPEPLNGLAAAFFAEANQIIDTPWVSAAVPDFIFPDTRGERPPDLEQRLQVAGALFHLAARDPAAHQLVTEVANLLKPRSAYQDPELREKLQRIMAER